MTQFVRVYTRNQSHAMRALAQFPSGDIEAVCVSFLPHAIDVPAYGFVPRP